MTPPAKAALARRPTGEYAAWESDMLVTCAVTQLPSPGARAVDEGRGYRGTA